MYKGVRVRFADLLSCFSITKLFHFYRIFAKGGRGFKRIPEPRLDLPLWHISSICMHTKRMPSWQTAIDMACEVFAPKRVLSNFLVSAAYPKRYLVLQVPISPPHKKGISCIP